MTTSRARHPEPERRPAPATRTTPSAARSAPQTVLRWQATAGNAAVAGLLARRPVPPAPVVARAEQGEDGDGGSWWSRAAGAARAAGRMKDLLGEVLGRGADVLGSIVRSPVAFLGNLVAGVKGGILRFRANAGDHLKRGLMGWLLGALAEGGVQLPATFDAKGIVSMLATMFGLTWNAIRTRVATRIGEGAMSAVEKGVEVFRLLSSQGVAGLWQMLLARLGNLQEMLLRQVREFVISRVLTAGVTWLIGILNPAAGIIKALKLIYDIVVFFRENASRLAKLVETVLESIADVARGSVGAVVNKVENVLGGMVPTLIGFIASVLGLGGIGQRIRAIVERMQKPVRAAVDAVIGVGLRLAGPLIKRFNKMRAGARAKVDAGKAWVKGKAEAGKEWAKRRAEAGRKWAADKVRVGVRGPRNTLMGAPKHPHPDRRTAREKQVAVDRAIKDAEAIMDRPRATRRTVAAALPAIKSRHRLSALTTLDDGNGSFKVHAELNPRADSKRKAEEPTWRLAPGGFAAHEGVPFVGSDGTPMLNRSKKPIMVHTIGRHVAIGHANVLARVVRGRLDIATGFLSLETMEKVVHACLNNRSTEINERLTIDGKPAGSGTSLTLHYRGNALIGYGYSVVKRSRSRAYETVRQSDLTGVTVHIRVVDREKRLFMVESAYPSRRA